MIFRKKQQELSTHKMLLSISADVHCGGEFNVDLHYREM